MNTDLAPPQGNLAGFVRWSEPGAGNSLYTITFGTWLMLIPFLWVAAGGLFCLVLPILAMTMPAPARAAPPQSEWPYYLVMWLFSLLMFWAARQVWVMAEPYRLSLDIATRHYTLRKGFRWNEKVWTGTFEDIREVYIWKRRPQRSYQYLYNVIISWKMSGVSTPLWTYNSKSADDPKPETWARIFCQELGVPFGGILTGDFVKRWKRD